MLKGSINVEAPVGEIRQALPWPVAAYIAEHGPEIIATIQAAIGCRDNVVARRQRAVELAAARMDEQRRRWRKAAREARAMVLSALAACGECNESAPGIFDIGSGILPPLDDSAGEHRLRHAEEMRHGKMQRRLSVLSR